MTDIRDGPIEELGLSVRAYGCLRRAGYSCIAQVAAMSDEDLLTVRNLGLRAFDEIRESIQKYAAEEPDEWDWRGEGGLGSPVPRRPSPGSLGPAAATPPDDPAP